MKVCARPGCAELTDTTYCPTHTPKPWGGQTGTQRRQQRGVTVSGWEDQQRNRRILRQHRQICHWCGHSHADQVDHVIERADGGADTPGNKRPIHRQCAHCGRRCHDEKTAEAKRHRTPGG